jgi:hypothetical protein
MGKKSKQEKESSMAKYSCAIEIPKWMDLSVVWPVLVWRWVWYGYMFRRIRLTRGKYTRVDINDYW